MFQVWRASSLGHNGWKGKKSKAKADACEEMLLYIHEQEMQGQVQFYNGTTVLALKPSYTKMKICLGGFIFCISFFWSYQMVKWFCQSHILLLDM